MFTIDVGILTLSLVSLVILCVSLILLFSHLCITISVAIHNHFFEDMKIKYPFPFQKKESDDIIFWYGVSFISMLIFSLVWIIIIPCLIFGLIVYCFIHQKYKKEKQNVDQNR